MKPEEIARQIKQEFEKYQFHLETTDPQLLFLLELIATDVVNLKEGNKWNKKLHQWEEPILDLF